MGKIHTFFEKAIPYAIAYGALRKTYHVNQPVGYPSETEDLYITTKVLIVAFGTANNIYLWPTAIVRDVYAFEGFMRGHVQSPARDILEVICK